MTEHRVLSSNDQEEEKTGVDPSSLTSLIEHSSLPEND